MVAKRYVIENLGFRHRASLVSPHFWQGASMSFDVNPYEAPSVNSDVPPLRSDSIALSKLFAASLMSFAGTCVAGSVFGVIGGIFGLIFGFFLAMIPAIPVTFVVFVIFGLCSRGRVKKRSVIALAAFSGAMSGLISCLWLAGRSVEGLAFGSIAAGIGAAVSATFTWQYLRTQHDTMPAGNTAPNWGDLDGPGPGLLPK